MPFKLLIMDGRLVPSDEARLHIHTPAVRYGAIAFEGIRAYWHAGRNQLYLFRPQEHIARLVQSARLMGMDESPHSPDELLDLIVELMKANDVREDVHIRPSLFVTRTGSLLAVDR